MKGERYVRARVLSQYSSPPHRTYPDCAPVHTRLTSSVNTYLAIQTRGGGQLEIIITVSPLNKPKGRQTYSVFLNPNITNLSFYKLSNETMYTEWRVKE